MRIKETIEIVINGQVVEVVNDGIKKLEDQAADTLDSVKDWVKGDIAKGKTNGWTPYANFESSLEWKFKH